MFFFFFSSRRRHTRSYGDWSSDVCSSDLCIGATTLDEYRKYIEKGGALERRFQQIIVNPPSKAEAVKILEGLRDRYEAHHHVQITNDALDEADQLSARYI